MNRPREEQFADLLRRIVRAPLYGGKLAGLAPESFSLSRLRELPLTTKGELRSAGPLGVLAAGRRDIARYHESTGTTGVPAASWFTREDLETGGRQVLECGAGLGPDDLVLVRFPYALALPAFLLEKAAELTGAGIVPASSRTTVTPYPKVLQLLGRLNVSVMAGLPREMELIAETARLQGKPVRGRFPALRALIVAGELLGARRRDHLERLWGVPVYNLYGSTETGNIAASCEYGALHVTERDFIVEVLRDDGKPAQAGERGCAAITTLSHQGSPLLRYYNEDILSLRPSDCRCGRSGAILTHYGRARERINCGGVLLDALDIQDAVYSLDPVPEAWLAEELEDGLDFFLDSHQIGGLPLERLRFALAERLGVPVRVQTAELIDRAALLRNDPSTKPEYIRKKPPEVRNGGGAGGGDTQ